jgi:hypothetical protein
VTDLDRAIEVARRLTEYSYWSSMAKLRKAIKAQLRTEGLEDQYRNFKLVSNGDGVNVYVRPVRK